VLADGAGVSRIFLSLVAPQDRQWMRTAMTRRVRPRWRRSPRAGGGSEAFLILPAKQAKIDGL
jgi:hypothetical protein